MFRKLPIIHTNEQRDRPDNWNPDRTYKIPNFSYIYQPVKLLRGKLKDSKIVLFKCYLLILFFC